MAKNKRVDKQDSFSKILFESTLGLCLLNREGEILQVNQSYCELLGYESNELIGENYYSLLPKEHHVQELHSNAEFWETKVPYSLVIQLLKKDQSDIELSINYSLAWYNNEEVKLCSVSEVSSLVRMNELMKRVTRQTKVGGWERDLSDDSIIWTDGIFNIYDLPVGEIPRFGDPELEKYFPKDGLDLIIESHNYTLNTGKKSEVITKFISEKGIHKWVKNTTEALVVNGKPVKLFGTFQDITDEKEKELHIYESQVRYKTLFEHNPTPLLLIDLENGYTILNVNDAACQLYGYDKDDFIGLTAIDLRPKEHVDSFLRGVNTRVNQTNLHKRKTHVTHLKKSGEQIAVEVHWSNFLIGEKKVQLVFINDITDRLIKEQQLSETNAFLSTMIETAPIAVVLLDNEAKVELWNHKAEETFGWSRDEALGKIIPYVPKSKKKELKDNLAKALSSNEGLRLELERVTRSGEIIYLREFVTPITNAEGINDKVLVLIEDITEAKYVQNALIESEFKYRNLVEVSNDLIWKMDQNGTVNFINNAVIRILGYNPDSISGSDFSKLIHSEYWERWEELYSKLKSGISVQNFDLILADNTGHRVILNATLHPMYDSQEELSGFSCYAADLTQVIEHKEHLETMLKEKEILIKEIHHRVKNNLAVVSSLLTLQSIKVNDESITQLLTESQSRIKSIATIHEKLYQNELFSSIEIKGYLRQLVQDIYDTYRSPDKEISVNVLGDDVYLNVNQAVPFAILANELVVNAFKYAFQGLHKGEINLFVTKNADGELTFTVSDNGVGLPENFSTENSNSLGMTLVENLTQQLSATLKVQSIRGASFSIRFTPEQ